MDVGCLEEGVISGKQLGSRDHPQREDSGPNSRGSESFWEPRRPVHHNRTLGCHLPHLFQSPWKGGNVEGSPSCILCLPPAHQTTCGPPFGSDPRSYQSSECL